MIRSNKRLSWLLMILLIAFLALIAYLVAFQFLEAPSLRDNSHNRRNWIDETKVARGSFYDRNGNLIVSSVKDDAGNVSRKAVNPNMYSALIGYNSQTYGKSGLEQSLNKYLLNIQDDNFISNLKGMVLDTDEGNDVYLSVDFDLQYLAYTALEGHKGAVVAMNPMNGQILAMASYPSYNVNTIDQTWNDIVESPDSRLLNRATQGLYTPGSIMKVITSMAILENGIDQSYDDKGTTVIDGLTIRNLNEKAYGPIELREALIHSSNVYFAEKTVALGATSMRDMAHAFQLDEKIRFELPTATPQLSFTPGMQETELAASGYGQGETLVTPLHMAMAIGAVANGGDVMQPTLIHHIASPRGDIIYTPSMRVLSRIGSPESVHTLQEDLEAVVQETHSQAIRGDYTAAGKTGTAQNTSGKDHAWFIGYAPATNPTIAIAVVLEEEGASGGSAAAPIAGQLFSEWLSR